MPILKAGELDIITTGSEQTHRLGIRLGALLQPGDVVCLSGDMGAGKTVFSAGIGAGWGAQHLLTSPTYTLVHEHRRDQDRVRLYHLDCYRLNRAADVESIGYDDIMDGRGVVVLEWPEKVLNLLPQDRLWVSLRVLDITRRNLIFEGGSQRYEALIERFRETTFGV
ncbi:MAG: tRNA (adenosine(37)-N6)-threonylcarbamoyltransferase complex ATPase subunit type 1 TsaE [Armatimonadetes bacterium]|nr:tRNA (adenosine(37)-N6)-threonylcarbamoyltransferase complex ATPase subunit type 1 TsaE [Anaerolineae bacterium]